MSNETIFREVDEELRGDRMRAIWRRFGPYIIGAAVAVVLIVAANEGWSWWQNSTAARSSDQFYAALELAERGDSESALTALNEVVAEGSGGYPTLARFRQTGLGLLADLVRRPRFDAGEFERVRQLRANRLRQLRDIPSATADRAFASALYGRHPYGHLAIGTSDALGTMTIDEVRALHRRAYRPSRAVLIVVGRAPHAQVVDEIATAFADWADPSDAAATPPAVDAPEPPAHRMWLVDRPGAAQSELRLGHVAVSRRTPDYHALLLVNLVLGGQFVSRLNMNLREHKGYTYGARSWFEFRLGPGPFQMSASVETDVTADAMREAIGEMTAIAGARAITTSELETARPTLTRGYPRNFETTDQMARSVAQLALYDLDDHYFAEFVPRVAGLSLDAVRSAAASHLHPDRLMAVVVGDAQRVAPTLEAIGLGVPRPLEVP